MKVLWIEDHRRVGELLSSAAAAASRKRFGIDFVLATSLLDAERKLRLERFDLVVIDLKLPDSSDEDVTVTRIANMGKFRVAIVSASDKRQQMIDNLTRAGVDCSPIAVGKDELDLGEFVKRPELFRDFINGLMSEPPAARAAGG